MSNSVVNKYPLSFKIILSSIVVISACSNTATTEVDKSASTDKPAAPTATFDTKKPTSYAEYKRWRKVHSPSNDAYADYKEWEIAYRRWKAQQNK